MSEASEKELNKKKLCLILTNVWRFCTAAMLHGRNNEKILHEKEFFFPIGKRIYISCHATWLPCKTSIEGVNLTSKIPFKWKLSSKLFFANAGKEIKYAKGEVKST